MRIFQVIEHSSNYFVSSNKTWIKNLHESLIDLGYDIFLFSAEKGRKAMITNDSRLRSEFSMDMIEIFKKEHKTKPFIVAFFYLMDGMFEPWALEEIRSSNVITTNFSCNNIHQFYLVEKISHLFDLNLFSEKEAKQKFDAINVKSLWWPLASNPKYFHPIQTEIRFDVSFVGARYSSRLYHINQLLLNNIDVHCFGPGWKINYSRDSKLIEFLKAFKFYFSDLKTLIQNNGLLQSESRVTNFFDNSYKLLLQIMTYKFPENFHSPVSDEELIRLYSSSKISLGFLEVFHNHNYTEKCLKHMHLRDFEAPMCGALYCTDYSDELAEMFDPKTEVIACRTNDERIDKINYFLYHESEANEIRHATRRRALNDHTYHKRFQTLFHFLGLKSE